MAGLLTYDWHPPDPTGAVNAYLSGMRIGVQQAAQAAHERDVAQKLAADALERQRLTKRFEEQHALQLQQEARLAGAEQLRQAYTQQRIKSAADEAAGRKKASEDIVKLYGGGADPLPSGGVVPASPAAALINPSSDPLVGQPPPIDPQDNATFDDFAGQISPVGNEAPIAPSEMLAMGRAGKLEKPTSAPAPPDPSRGASAGLPAASATPMPASQLLVAADGLEPVAKPRPGAVPDMGSILRAMSSDPKRVLGVAEQMVKDQARQAMKPVSTPKPDPIITLADGQKARVAANNSVTPIGPPKPAPVVTPQQQEAMMNTERDNATGDATRFQKQLGELTKGKKPVDLGYAWEPVKGSGKWYRMGDPKAISAQQAAAQNDVAQKIADLKVKIEGAEKKAQAIDARVGGTAPATEANPGGDKRPLGTIAKKDGKTYLKTAQGWVEQ